MKLEPFFGHAMKAANTLERKVMLAKVQGKRKRSRLGTGWLAGILQATGKCLGELKELVLSRSHWRSYICGVTRSR